MFNRGDFHIHSTSSDGSCSPKEIITIAKKRNIDIISLTDHNSTSGINEAIEYGNKINIKVIPGIELSTRFNNIKVHVLGYFKDDSYKNELLIEILSKIRCNNISKVRSLLKGYLSPYYRGDKISTESGIEILKFFGAVVILAHPVLLPRESFKQIIDLNFDGLEAKYFSNTPKDTEYFLNIANEKNLIYTAGSDFHKNNELYRTHGLIGDVYLNSTEINEFLTCGKLNYVQIASH